MTDIKVSAEQWNEWTREIRELIIDTLRREGVIAGEATLIADIGMPRQPLSRLIFEKTGVRRDILDCIDACDGIYKNRIKRCKNLYGYDQDEYERCAGGAAVVYKQCLNKCAKEFGG